MFGERHLLPGAGCLLLLTLFCGRGASGARGVIAERRWIRGEYKNPYRPPNGPGGPFGVTPIKPDKAFRWTFEGINYDSPPHQVATAAANKEYTSCVGDYVRCLMRDSKPSEICAFDSVGRYYYRFYSICEVEYQNCLYSNVIYGHKYNTLDHTFNRFLYDGEGWYDDKDAPGSFFGGRWYCYWADLQQTSHGMRRAGPNPGPNPGPTIPATMNKHTGKLRKQHVTFKLIRSKLTI